MAPGVADFGNPNELRHLISQVLDAMARGDFEGPVGEALLVPALEHALPTVAKASRPFDYDAAAANILGDHVRGAELTPNQRRNVLASVILLNMDFLKRGL